jgi:hypothetical protein
VRALSEIHAPLLVRSRSDRFVEPVRNSVQILIEQIGVDVERHRGFGMAEHSLHRLHVGTGANGETGGGVSKIV